MRVGVGGTGVITIVGGVAVGGTEVLDRYHLGLPGTACVGRTAVTATVGVIWATMVWKASRVAWACRVCIAR